ncbi:uncharacterized protein LOC122510671 isoform X2 [Leptopilina heterotoma]|uniref:uncharacterized protein LOC122510671 isoform X2 n=1 Tax=Leptopilina heterotoma TaxID=63436 RepID=UPI001CA88777|nr:uncharacterized protein LOC122510671 isoform X2 [Leptopilina heterotoma]
MKFLLLFAIAATLTCQSISFGDKDIPSGIIDVYDVQNSKVRLVIPINKDEYVQDNYFLEVYNKNTSASVNCHKVDYMQILDSLVVFVSKLTPSTTYKFRVVDKRNSIFYESLDVTTNKALGKPKKPDENMFYISFVDRKATIFMKQHSNWIHCEIGYEICLLNSTTNEKITESRNLRCTHNSSVHFNNLSKGNNYKVQIRACNMYGCSDPVISKEYKSGKSESDINVLNITDTTCSIKWKKLTNNSKDTDYIINVIDIGYRYLYFHVEQNQDQNITRRILSSNSSDTPFTIDHLKPGNVYHASISTQDSKSFVLAECKTLPLTEKPATPFENSFNISFESGGAKVTLLDDSLQENCALWYTVSIYKADTEIFVEDRNLTCIKYKYTLEYLAEGIYSVRIIACNKIGCSDQWESKHYKPGHVQFPKPLSYKVLNTTDSTCKIQWIKQNDISHIHEKIAWIPGDHPKEYYVIQIIVIGIDANDINTHFARDACIAHHSKHC